MRRKGLAHDCAPSPAPRAAPRTITHDFGPADALSCRECGQRYPLGARLRLRGVLRPARGRLRLHRLARAGAEIEAGPAHIWRYRAAAARPRRRGRRTPNLNPGLHQARQGRQPGPGARADRPLWVKDDSGNPTHSFKDRVVAMRRRAARALRLHHPLLLLHRQPGRRRRAPPPPARAAVLRVHPARPGAGQGRHGRRLRRRRWSPSRATTTTSTASAPSSPATIREGWGFVNVNLRPYYAEGSQDPRLRDRRAARLAAARPGRRRPSPPARCSRRSTRRSAS